jgi:hypothetical protein
MRTLETPPPETAALESERESIRNFLRVSSAYLFSCAYRDSWRAAYARQNGATARLSLNCNAGAID